MGIPRLKTRLAEQGTRKTLGRANAITRHSVAVIDGSNLAYCVYYRLLDTPASSSAAISYSCCAEETIKWLDQLSSFGFDIEAIFFDGALPEHKRSTRLDRLQQYVAKLHACKSSTRNGLSNRSSLTKALPPPPFLVSAVIEGLLRSHYVNVTYTVPGEADAFCVAVAHSISSKVGAKTITLVSDDSDLLVYRMDVQTRVVPIQDLSEIKHHSGTVLTGLEYWPAQIARRFGFSDLIKPAFAMYKDPDCTFKQACRLASDLCPTKHAGLKQFAEMFDTRSEMFVWDRLLVDVQWKDAMLHRDARISELIYQLDSGQDRQGELDMYLPVLIEDLSRFSVWKLGADIRTLAYSLLFAWKNCRQLVREFRRSGDRIHAIDMTRIEIRDIGTELDRISELIELRKTEVSWEGSQPDSVHVLRRVIMCQTLHETRQFAAEIPPMAQVVQVFCNEELGTQWRIVHFAAQFQAVFCSFRILQQVILCVWRDSIEPTIDNALRRLGQKLEVLPGIIEFHSLVHIGDLEGERRGWSSIIANLTKPSSGKSKVKNDNKMAGKEKKAAKRGSNSNTFGGNRFAPLAG